jgi:hypothetical protein
MNIIVNEVRTENGQIARIIKTFSLAEVSVMKPYGTETQKEEKKKIIRVRRTS